MPLKLTREDYNLCDHCGQEHGATKSLHYTNGVLDELRKILFKSNLMNSREKLAAIETLLSQA